MTDSDTERPAERSWQPTPHPDWVTATNREGEKLDLCSVVPLDAASLMAAASTGAGLTDFGEDDSGWREGLETLSRALDEEAQLSLIGRLMARSDLIIHLQARLNLAALWKAETVVLEQEIRRPLFIVGLPRSGTSILYELLSQDQRFRVPASWEALFPCPPPGTAGAEHSEAARAASADALLRQWAQVAPEFATMHEMGGKIPCECGMLMAPTMLSDHIVSHYQVPSYHVALAEADMAPIYAYHRRMLQTLQWRRGGEHGWLLKQPGHLGLLPQLFATYPDARLIQTHRDPLKCMASATSLLGTLYWIRSDAPFEASAFEDLIFGAATAGRLTQASAWRDEGAIPAAQIMDSRYQDLIDDPVAAVRRIYDFLELPFGEAEAERITDYLRCKPKSAAGVHSYEHLSAEQANKERPLFRDYQARFGVPDEI